MDETTTVIFSGGTPPDAEVVARLPVRRFVIAADSGLDHASRFGVAVDLLVGDLDSVSPALVASAARVQRHPVDKDATDLELALEAALEIGSSTVVVSGDGGRLDHLLAEAALVASPRWAALSLHAWLGGSHLLPVHGGQERALDATVGATVTLLAPNGPARGVRTVGLRWALHGDTLMPGSTRGVSNVVSANRAVIGVDDGTVVVIVPATSQPDRG